LDPTYLVWSNRPCRPSFSLSLDPIFMIPFASNVAMPTPYSPPTVDVTDVIMVATWPPRCDLSPATQFSPRAQLCVCALTRVLVVAVLWHAPVSSGDANDAMRMSLTRSCRCLWPGAWRCASGAPCVMIFVITSSSLYPSIVVSRALPRIPRCLCVMRLVLASLPHPSLCDRCSVVGHNWVVLLPIIMFPSTTHVHPGDELVCARASN
jgi:hypothetical protein